jgi:hypothetical protein
MMKPQTGGQRGERFALWHSFGGPVRLRLRGRGGSENFSGTIVMPAVSNGVGGTNRKRNTDAALIVIEGGQ